MPALPPALPAAPPSGADPEARRAREQARRTALARSGYASTIATSGAGDPSTARTTAALPSAGGFKALLGA